MSCIYYFFYNEVLRDALPECGGAKDTYNRNKTFNLKIDFLRTENIHTSPSPLWFSLLLLLYSSESTEKLWDPITVV